MNAQILALLEDPLNMQQVTDCLERLGHRVLKADRLEQALSLIGEQTVDLIVSDVHLQNGGNVFSFLVMLNSNPTLETIPFVCFTFQPTQLATHLASGVETAARMLGADGYISMDRFDSEQFGQHIERLLPQRQEAPCLVAKHASAV